MTSTTATIPTQTPALKIPPMTAQPFKDKAMGTNARQAIRVEEAFMLLALAVAVP